MIWAVASEPEEVVRSDAAVPMVLAAQVIAQRLLTAQPLDDEYSVGAHHVARHFKRLRNAGNGYRTECATCLRR